MKPLALLALRASLGLLMVIWGVDKVINVDHAVRVSESFYGGVVTGPGVWRTVGIAQIALGALIVMGLFRRVVLPILASITAVTFVAVWRSIVDPLGLVLTGGNMLFFPSSTIFAAALVLVAFRAEDRWSVDAFVDEGAVGRHASVE